MGVRWGARAVCWRGFLVSPGCVRSRAPPAAGRDSCPLSPSHAAAWIPSFSSWSPHSSPNQGLDLPVEGSESTAGHAQALCALQKRESPRPPAPPACPHPATPLSLPTCMSFSGPVHRLGLLKSAPVSIMVMRERGRATERGGREAERTVLCCWRGVATPLLSSALLTTRPPPRSRPTPPPRPPPPSHRRRPRSQCRPHTPPPRPPGKTPPAPATRPTGGRHCSPPPPPPAPAPAPARTKRTGEEVLVSTPCSRPAGWVAKPGRRASKRARPAARAAETAGGYRGARRAAVTPRR